MALLNPKIAAKLAEIEAMDREKLIQLWHQTFKHSQRLHSSQRSHLPRGSYPSTVFMRKVLAYEAQCQGQRKLARTARQWLQTSAQENKPLFLPGTELVRDWQGRHYRLQIAKDGVYLGDQRFASLSAAAKHITGAHWSGPRFFGLNRKAEQR